MTSFSAIPAARYCRSTMRCSSRTPSATSWCATSRRRCMRPKAMRAPPARSACVLVTSGPGATNAVTGLTDALMDSIPLVCLTGQVPTHLIGNDAFQEADTTGITRPCTKHNYLVKTVERPGRGSCTRPSMSRAPAGPGPVVVDLPKDVLIRPRRLSRPPTRVKHQQLPARRSRPTGEQIAAAVAADRQGQAADRLCRRRRDQCRPDGVACCWRDFVRMTGLPVHQDADGPGRLCRPAIRSSWACWACTGPTRPTWRCTTAM